MSVYAHKLGGATGSLPTIHPKNAATRRVYSCSGTRDGLAKNLPMLGCSQRENSPVSICGNLRNLAKRADTLFENKRTRGLIAKPVKKCFEAAIPPKAVREIFVDDIHGVIEVPEHDGFFRPAPFSVPRVVRWCVEALRIRLEKEASTG